MDNLLHSRLVDAVKEGDGGLKPHTLVRKTSSSPYRFYFPPEET